MYRSSSVSRSLDGPLVSPPRIKQSILNAAVDLLPTYTQWTDDRGKKQSRFRAEHSVHIIPVVLILCGLVLWFAGGAPEGDFALGRHDEVMMNKSSTIGEVLEEKEEMIPSNSLHLERLNNGSMDGETIMVKDS